MSSRLAGKRALIVGGSSGIGLAAARRFLEEGAQLAIAGMGDDPQIGAPFIQADVSVADQVERLFAETLQKLGGLDIIYHVAGSSGRRHGDGPLHECSDAGWDMTIALNLHTVFLTNRAALRHWLDFDKPGVLLNMASVLAYDPAPRFFDTAAYAAAKGGVISMSRLAAARYASQGIRVNVIAPGLIDTPMSRRACQDEAILHYLRGKQPLRKGPGLAEDCADAAVFLCSDESRFITGTVLPVDGGWGVSEGSVPGS